VISERARGVLLYALTGLVLLGGGVWFVLASPRSGEDARVQAWRATVEQTLPDTPLQALAGTVVLSNGAGTERSERVDGGSYTLTVVCAGTGIVRIQLSTSGDDSGRAVPCMETPNLQRLTVALADEFFIRMSSEPAGDDGTAVFRWRLERSRRY
jgi:hypothetical protein